MVGTHQVQVLEAHDLREICVIFRDWKDTPRNIEQRRKMAADFYRDDL